jgi:hypothetical protein
MGLRKKSTYGVLLVVVLVFAVEMLAVAAWAQDKDGKTTQEEQRSKKSSQTRVQTKETTETPDRAVERLAAKNPSTKVKDALKAAQNNSSSDLDGIEADITPSGGQIASLTLPDTADCTVVAGDSIIFNVSGPDNTNSQVTFALVINGNNAEINDDGDITVDPIGSQTLIKFYTDGSNNQQTLSAQDTLTVDSSSIDCGNNNNNNHHHRHRHNGNNNNNGNNQYRQYNNNQYNGNNDDNNNEDTFGSADINTETSTSSGEQYANNNEDSNGNGGAFAQSGEDQASAGGSPDQLSPVTEPQGDVVNEVPTEGELPNTRGASLLSYALPSLGCVLLLAALLRHVRSRR